MTHGTIITASKSPGSWCSGRSAMWVLTALHKAVRLVCRVRTHTTRCEVGTGKQRMDRGGELRQARRRKLCVDD